MESVFYGFETLNNMITKEKILEILHQHSYNVEDQARNHLIVVDYDSWDEVAEQVKNCSIPDVGGRSEQLLAVAEYVYNHFDDSSSKTAKDYLQDFLSQ